jgi:hypothetical protein
VAVDLVHELRQEVVARAIHCGAQGQQTSPSPGRDAGRGRRRKKIRRGREDE